MLNTELANSSLHAYKSYIDHLSEYEVNGFTIFRNVIDQDLLGEASQHFMWLREKFQEFRPEHLHHPLMRDDAFWVRLVTDPRLLDIAEFFLGPDIACFTAHYICKPPLSGQAVLWHQDGAYWKLSPMEAATLWLAVDESTTENGCLRMIPGSHKLPLQKIVLRSDLPNMLNSSIGAEYVDSTEVVDIELQPGDVSVHHPNIIHGSEPNRSAKRRCGLDLGFMRTSTSISNEGLYLNPILARGEPVSGVNRYRAWPAYKPDTSMSFAGHESWNEKISYLNAQSPDLVYPQPGDESVEAITRRMMARLKEGTTKK